MRHTVVPATLIAACWALAACGPSGPATPAASASASAPAGQASAAPGASAAPATGTPASGAPASQAPATITDLATKYPLSATGKRRLVYSWTATDTRGSKAGTDDAFDITKCDSSCNAYVTRTEDGKAVLTRDSQTLSRREGVLIPSIKVFKDQTVDIEAELKKGATLPEETITVKAGTFKVQKLTYGGSRSFTYWFQKPYVIKAEYKSTDESTTAELQSIE